MGHATSGSYYKLQKRLDNSPHGAPPSETLFKILEVLFTENEAELVSVLPIGLFTVEDAAKIWKKSKEDSKETLDSLADKGIFFDVKKGETQAYMLAPPMTGFFEFSLMRTDGKFDKKVLSELFYQYINTEDDFLKNVLSINPNFVRTLVQEDAIQPKDKVLVLDYEKASHIIKTASCVSLGTCYCRHRREHVGKACNKPQKTCLSFNKGAESLVRHNLARKVSKKKAFEILDKCMKLGLVQLGDNVQDDVNFICNCCSCCCDLLFAYKNLGHNTKLTSNFAANNKIENCIGCGSCAKHCPVGAIKIHNDGKGKRYAKVNQDICIGCGVCTRFCPVKSMIVERRKEIAFVPKDNFERYVLAAIEKGKLQNLIFDNYHHWTNELSRQLLGIIISLEPTKRLLAQRQIQSRFINAVIKTKRYALLKKLYNDGKTPDYSHPELQKKRVL